MGNVGNKVLRITTTPGNSEKSEKSGFIAKKIIRENEDKERSLQHEVT